MRASGLRSWVPLLARYSMGQLAVQAINLATGLLILRLLSIEEYALYIVASLLQSVGSIGSDLGVSQGVVSVGAPIRDDRASLGALVRGAIALRKRFFAATVPIVVLVAYALLHDNASRWEAMAAVTLLALGIAWAQQSVSVATATLNAHHDSGGLVRAGLAHAVTRLALVGALCSAAPFALAALAVNLVGALLQGRLLWLSCADYLGGGLAAEGNYERKLTTFIKPLLPGIIYYLVQGHVATFLLAWAGATVAVAEVGALGRLGQIIALVGLLNGFFIQPYFARISDRRLFARRLAQIVSVVLTGFFVVTISALVVPDAWLAVLGSAYKGLTSELVIAVIGAQLSVAGGILYTILISTGRTRGQWWQIALGLSAQIVFIALIDVQDARAALILNLLPATTYVCLQAALLVNIFHTWNRHS